MKIHGFQKLTLLDYPDKVACIVFFGGCNFRCPFCHNASLVTHLDGTPTVDEAEVFDYLDKRGKLLDGVCITGGEPLMRPDIREFIEKIRSRGLSVKLDTNGSYPSKLKELVNDGLVDYVAMDIKNCKEKYPLTAGIEDLSLHNIEESVSFLLEGHTDYEFRTTVTNELHTPEDIGRIAQWIKGAKRYFIQNFADSGDLIAGGHKPVSKETICEMCDAAETFSVPVKVRE